MKRRNWFVAGPAAALMAAVSSCAGMAATAAPATPAPIATPSEARAPDPSGRKPCFMVVMGTVTDRTAFRAYAAALPPLYAQFGGVYLAVQRGPIALEGMPDFESIVISRWPNCAAANAFWTSADYRKLVEMRKDWGRFTVVLAEGLESPTHVAPAASAPAAKPSDR